jgi:hypothetical protein
MALIKRKAVLIGAPGKDTNFLRGVKHDLNNIKTFLQSERGGSYYSHEIIVLINPSRGDILSAIHGASVDYMLVYFSGHGYTKNGIQRMISLDGYELKDTQLLNYQCPRELVIIDACRNFMGGAIGAITGLGDEYDNFTGSRTRDIFDQWIAASPAGQIIIHATEPGTSAGDTPRGGVFSRQWVQLANNYIINEPGPDFLPVSITQLLTDTRNVLFQRQSHQRPEIVHNTGNLQVPFAVARQVERSVYYDEQDEALVTTPPQPAGNGGGVALAIIAGLCLLAIFSGSNSSQD